MGDVGALSQVGRVSNQAISQAAFPPPPPKVSPVIGVIEHERSEKQRVSHS
jgi:hypothetical protein